MKAHKLDMIQSSSEEFTLGSTTVTSFDSFKTKNKIINGNFDIWQRGSGAFTSNEYTADHWRAASSGSSHSLTRQLFTLGQTDVPNEPIYYLRDVVTSSAGAANYSYIQQPIERVRTLAGQTATLSLYAKADSSKDIAVEFIQYFGSGGSPSSNVSFGVTTFSLTSSWQEFTVSINTPSISGKTIGSDSNDYVGLRIWFDAGSNYDSRTNSLGQQSGTFDIAQVQLEKGDEATPFEERHIGIEFALCQRYFQEFVFTNYTPLGIARSGAAGTIMTSSWISFPVEMRTAPTVTQTSSAQCAYVKTDTQTSQNGVAGAATATTTSTGFYPQETEAGTNNDAYMMYPKSDMTLEFDAEL